MIVYGEAPSLALTRSPRSEGHFISLAEVSIIMSQSS